LILITLTLALSLKGEGILEFCKNLYCSGILKIGISL
jgi:hypothetical protein